MEKGSSIQEETAELSVLEMGGWSEGAVEKGLEFLPGGGLVAVSPVGGCWEEHHSSAGGGIQGCAGGGVVGDWGKGGRDSATAEWAEGGDRDQPG